MGKLGTKMPKFCLSRIRPLVRVRSQPMQSKIQENPTSNGDEEKIDGFVDGGGKDISGGGVGKSSAISGRKVMVVVDSSGEAKNALEWALSHTVQNQDIMVLLHVIKPLKQGDRSNVNTKVPEFLTSVKYSCQVKRPQACARS
ncbi:hypothetical protein OROHE_023043 [Orobanche hederae]